METSTWRSHIRFVLTMIQLPDVSFPKRAESFGLANTESTPLVPFKGGFEASPFWNSWAMRGSAGDSDHWKR